MLGFGAGILFGKLAKLPLRKGHNAASKKVELARMKSVEDGTKTLENIFLENAQN